MRKLPWPPSQSAQSGASVFAVLTTNFVLGERPVYPTNRRRVRLLPRALVSLLSHQTTWYVSQPVSPFNPVAHLPTFSSNVQRDPSNLSRPEYVRRLAGRHSIGWAGLRRQVTWRRGGASRKRHWNVQVGAARRCVTLLRAKHGN